MKEAQIEDKARGHWGRKQRLGKKDIISPLEEFDFKAMASLGKFYLVCANQSYFLE